MVLGKSWEGDYFCKSGDVKTHSIEEAKKLLSPTQNISKKYKNLKINK